MSLYLVTQKVPSMLSRDVMENIELAVHITMIIDKWKSEEIFS